MPMRATVKCASIQQNIGDPNGNVKVSLVPVVSTDPQGIEWQAPAQIDLYRPDSSDPGGFVLGNLYFVDFTPAA